MIKYNGCFYKKPIINFQLINKISQRYILCVVQYWLPNGKRLGNEWVALNPTRPDKNIGSFRICLVTGRWIDYATHDAGGDLISLIAYLTGSSQAEAAIKLANQIGVNYEA